MRQRSNSIKSHLWSIDSKNIATNKPRNHVKRIEHNQRSGERSSLTRTGAAYHNVSKTLRENSMNGTITTPDKHIPVGNSLYKNSSSQKKSSVKTFKPTEIKQWRIPRPALYDLNDKKPKLNSRNGKMDHKIPVKLDFDNNSLKISSSSRPRKSLNPSTTSYKKISQMASYSNIAANKENMISKRTSQNLKPQLKLKITRSKIYSTIDSQSNLARNQSLINVKSRNTSKQRLNDWVKNYRSMSNLKQASNVPNIHNTSITKYSTNGLSLNLGNPSHNKS